MTTENTGTQFNPQYCIYKAKKDGTGAATQFEYGVKAGNVFLTIAQQTGMDANENSTFGWRDDSKKIVMKLGEPDIGEILCVLRGIKQQAGSGKGLFHQNEKGNKVLEFGEYVKDNILVGYSLRVSFKKTGENEAFRISHMVSPAEAQVLLVVLQQSLLYMLKW